MRLPVVLSWEWTTVIPDDHPMAPFTNGQVRPGGKREPVQFKTGVMYRRRVLTWRGRWREQSGS